MAKQTDRVLSDILLKEKLLTQEQIFKASTEAQSAGESLQSFILSKGLLSEKQILKALASQLTLPLIDVKNSTIDKIVLDKVPVKFAVYYKFMPIKFENKSLVIAVSDPLDLKLQDEIRIHLGFQTHIVLATENDILETIKKSYGLAAETIDRILTKEPERKVLSEVLSPSVEDLEQKFEDASVMKLVNQIIFEAYKKRATDIHIEPYRDKVRFRYRIDGVLVDANLPAEIKHFIQPIISRIKIMSNLSIVEKRVPQDGSAVVKTKEQTLDLRVSTIPTPRGESIVIRILPTKVMLFSLEKLGLSPGDVKIFRELIKHPHGIIFVTGPTGSGKTTTLYAVLNEINSSERKIITIEDPVEYEMEGITQIQVNPKVDLDFAKGLRSVLRHDPDILMVGEVRDLETAEISIRTALTGHLVFSTLHTNDAASAPVRLIEMGLEPFLVVSSVEAFVAQRLVRIICPQCKEEDKDVLPDIRQEIAASLNVPDDEKIKVYKGRGCEHCNHTGYYGRTGIYEILVVNEAIRSALLDKPRVDHVRQIALQYGMRTLRQDGWRKVFEGVTTPLEVMNAAGKDELEETNERLTTEEEDVPSGVTPTNISQILKERYRIISSEVLSAKNEFDARVYQRIAQKVPLRHTILHGEVESPYTLTVKGSEHSTVTKDISAGGLVFLSGTTLSMGTIVELKIQIGEGNPDIECLARVCRVEENKLTSLFHVAVYYLDLSSADRVKLNNFVKSKLTEEKEP